MIPLNLVVMCVLKIWTIGDAADCGNQQGPINGRCCDMCPPGTYLKEFCSEHQKTDCVPCPEGYYSDKFNFFDRCERCQSCQEYAEKCNLTTNAKCMCHSGFLCSNNVCSSCEENKCATWEKLKKTGIPSGEMEKYSYRCEPACSNNTYFDVKENICKPFTQCSTFGFGELFRGNKTHNSVCTTHGNKDRDSFHVILGIGLALLCHTLFVFLCYTGIKKCKENKKRTAVDPNTNDFHLSKEESGLGFLLLDKSTDSNSFCSVPLGKVTVV